MLWKRFLYAFFLLAALCPSKSSAHFVGISYNLPVPAWLFIYGGAAAVLLSFFVIGYFVNQKTGSEVRSALDISSWQIIRLVKSLTVQMLIKGLSLILFTLTIATALFGNEQPDFNFSPTFFWIIVVLGLTYVSAIFGNVWSVVNPWKTLVELWEFVTNRNAAGRYSYLNRAKYLPALIFYVIFIWLELLSEGRASEPRFLGSLLLDYTIMNILAVYLWGERRLVSLW